jgi:hygromycin-B 4-O-kinase
MPDNTLSIVEVSRLVRARRSAPFELEQLSHGENSQAFVLTSGTVRNAFRVGSDTKGYRKDEIAARRWRSVQLRIPSVMEIGWLTDSLSFCVSELLPGRSMQRLRGTELAGAAQAAISSLEMIHAQSVGEVRGCGSWFSEGPEPFPTWRHALAAICDESIHHWAEWPTDLRVRITPILDRIGRLTPDCPDLRQLIHGDFGPGNILISNGRVTGILDWEKSAIGDPYWDFANLYFWSRASREMAELWRAARDRVVLSDHAGAARLECYALSIGLMRASETFLTGRMYLSEQAIFRAEDILRAPL